MAVVPKRLTVEEFLQLPEEDPALEFIDAGVVQKVSPKGRHGTLQLVFGQALNEHARQHKLGWVVTETRATFAGRSVVPDISVYRWDRVPVGPDHIVADDFYIPPDIAVEIASPDQSSTTLVRKCLWYVANGVQIALLVDPADTSVLVFRPDQPALALRGPDEIDLQQVLPDFRLTVEQLLGALQRG